MQEEVLTMMIAVIFANINVQKWEYVLKGVLHLKTDDGAISL